VQSPGEGQLAVNALQVLEVLADDSNFRRMAMQSIAPAAAAILSAPAPDFASSWCAGAALIPALSSHHRPLLLLGSA
jgi:hypothetical protein